MNEFDKRTIEVLNEFDRRTIEVLKVIKLEQLAELEKSAVNANDTLFIEMIHEELRRRVKEKYQI